MKVTRWTRVVLQISFDHNHHGYSSGDNDVGNKSTDTESVYNLIHS